MVILIIRRSTADTINAYEDEQPTEVGHLEKIIAESEDFGDGFDVLHSG